MEEDPWQKKKSKSTTSRKKNQRKNAKVVACGIFLGLVGSVIAFTVAMPAFKTFTAGTLADTPLVLR